MKGGSLVCLSSNDFRTIEYFATIAGDRRSEKCAAKNNNGKGQRELSFRHETSMDSIRKTFVMIEAPAFFMVSSDLPTLHMLFYSCYSRFFPFAGIPFQFGSIAIFRKTQFPAGKVHHQCQQKRFFTCLFG